MILGLINNLLGLAILLALVIFLLSRATGTRFMDWLSPSRWKSVLTYTLKWLLLKLGDKPGLLHPHEIEQYMFRIKSCEQCLPTNKCVSCGCNTLARMNITGDSCSAGRWGPFQDKETWDETKFTLGIELKVFLDGKEVQDIDIF